MSRKGLNDDEIFGQGYDLASVHSDNEQAFLSAIMAENDPGSDVFWEFWIGYRDYVHWEATNTFVWSDGTPNDYTNWAQNEPNDNLVYENICVEMYAHNDYDIGHWNDLTCDRELGFICRTRASGKVIFKNILRPISENHRNWILLAIIIQIFVYFAISKRPGAKLCFKIAILIKFDEIR